MSSFAKENSVPETWLKKEGTISITYQCNLHINTRIQINMRGGKLPSSVFGEEVLVFFSVGEPFLNSGMRGGTTLLSSSVGNLPVLNTSMREGNLPSSLVVGNLPVLNRRYPSLVLGGKPSRFE
jgi:hypothetical protein